MNRTILNKVINNIDTVDLTYYFRAEKNMTYKEAMEEVSKIAKFLNTDFNCFGRDHKDPITE